jgi:ubiquinone/menaquinone biosynthesis C-methylase UbiE
VKDDTPHSYKRRYAGGAERLRAPQRMVLLETVRVVQLCREGLSAATVLDVGTGSGVFAEAFVAAALRVTGIDPSAALLAQARELVPMAVFREGTAEDLPFPDASFDLVFLGHVLHETNDPLSALREARRVAAQRVAVFEWPYREEEQGPPLADRLQPDKILSLARQAGYLSIERLELARMDLYRLTP